MGCDQCNLESLDHYCEGRKAMTEGKSEWETDQ
jgi:hypothetical protein